MTRLKVIKREEWQALPAKSAEPLKHPAPMLCLMDTKGKDCSNLESCTKRVQEIQKYYMEEKGFDDIPWSFLVGGDGSIFEGRGYKINPIKTDLTDKRMAENDGKSIDIAYIGDYSKKYTKFKMQSSVGDLISYGMKKEYLVMLFVLKPFIKTRSIKNRIIDIAPYVNAI